MLKKRITLSYKRILKRRFIELTCTSARVYVVNWSEAFFKRLNSLCHFNVNVLAYMRVLVVLLFVTALLSF